jgi:hypothetical protein
MADFEYTLGLNAEPFIGGAKAAETAEEKMTNSIVTGSKESAAAIKEMTAAVNPWTTAAKSAAEVTASVGAAVRNTGAAASSFGPPVKGFAQFLADLAAQKGAGEAVNGAASGVSSMGKEAAAHMPKVRTLAEYMRQIPGLGAEAKTGFSNAGMGMLMLSQTLDDAQYGLRGIMNNIPGLVMSFGGSAGLAGAVQVATIAFAGLAEVIVTKYKKAWDDMVGNTAYEKLKQRNEEMIEQHDRMLARLRGEAGQSGARAANDAADVAGIEDRTRKADQERFEQKKKELELDHQIAREKLAGLAPAEKAKALNELEKHQAAEKLELERRFYAERVENTKRLTGLTGDRHKDEAKLRALEREKRDIEIKPEDERRETEKRRMAQLPGLIQAEKTRLDSGRGALEGDQTELRRVEREKELQGRRNQLGDMRTQRTLDQEAERAAEQRRQESDAVMRRQLDSRFHPDNQRAAQEAEKAAKEKQTASLKEEAQKRGVDTRQPGWGFRLRDSILGNAESDDNEEDEDAPRSARGRSRGGRIRGAISRDSYQRDRTGRVFAMGQRAADDTRDPRIAARGKPAGETQLTKGETAMLKVLGDMYKELRKQNSGNAKK